MKQQQLGDKIEADDMQPGVHLAWRKDTMQSLLRVTEGMVWRGVYLWDARYTVEPYRDAVGFNQQNVDEAGCPPDDPNDIHALLFTTLHQLLHSRVTYFPKALKHLVLLVVLLYLKYCHTI